MKRNAIVPIVGVFVFSGALIAALAFWGDNRNVAEVALTSDEEVSEVATPLRPQEAEVMQPAMSNEANPIVVLSTNYGDIEIELFADRMPITAGNFKKLVSEGFYDGVKFHRVMDGFMIQGGDPNTKTDNTTTWGTGGPGYAIPDEHVAGEGLSNTRGTISMANSGPNSGGSQFFINLVDNTFLDFDKDPLTSKHPVFGRVLRGMDVVDQIAGVATGARDIPVEPVVIESAVVREGALVTEKDDETSL